MVRKLLRIAAFAFMALFAATVFTACEEDREEDREESAMPPGHDVMYKCAKCGKTKSHPSNAAQGPSC